jgi:hypothetical protein
VPHIESTNDSFARDSAIGLGARAPKGTIVHRHPERYFFVASFSPPMTSCTLPYGFVGAALRLQLGIADEFADGFLHGTFDFFRRSRDTILIHILDPFITYLFSFARELECTAQ